MRTIYWGILCWCSTLTEHGGVGREGGTFREGFGTKDAS